MKTLKNDHYAYRVIWSEEEEYIGLCAAIETLLRLKLNRGRSVKKQ